MGYKTSFLDPHCNNDVLVLLMLRKVNDHDECASVLLRISRQSVVSVVPVVVLVNVRLKAAATVLGTCTRTTAVPWWEPGCHQAQTTYRHNVSCLKAATRQGNEQQAWLFPPSLISTLAVFYRKYQIVKQFSLLALFGSSSTSPTFCLRNCPADRQWIIEETGCLLVSAITIAA